MVALVLTGILLRYFYLQQQLRLQEKLELLARLESLRARIRPHFLFNTLNSIASLIMSRPDAAEQAVEDLSELFRASLKEGQFPTTVADELRLCELYLGIEQLRLGERLKIDWQVDNGVRGESMPSVLLQPLVENAVYHGIARIPEGGTISVVVRREGEQLRISVENPLPESAETVEGNHMALANVGQRLQALYGSGASLVTTPGNGQFRVELSYPLGQPL
jgi:two-component system sensor histidine kinase AlgZ